MTNQEIFEAWFKKNFNDLHEAICCGDLVAKNYKKAMWKAWQAATQREGYKFVPLEATKVMIEIGKKNHSYNEFEDDVVGIYTAMIGAAP